MFQKNIIKVGLYFASIIIILILIKKYCFNNLRKKNTYENENYNKKERIKLTQKYLNKPLKKCNTYTISNSTGLLIDEMIVCDTLKELKATPFFYFEDFNNNSIINDWIFVNLDCTNFKNLMTNKNAPQNILCKNYETMSILSNIFPKENLIYTGFTSIDRFDPSIKKDYTKFLHVVGKSPNKGTIQLVKTWNLHPEWPTVTIICNNHMGVVNNIYRLLNGTINKNIKLISEFISEDELSKLMNEYGIHICISRYEGFGHTSNEARSTGSVVLYTDMPSFKDRFKDGINGIAVKSKKIGMINGICPAYEPEVADIEYSVNKIIKMKIEDLIKIGKCARQDFIKDDIYILEYKHIKYEKIIFYKINIFLF